MPVMTFRVSKEGVWHFQASRDKKGATALCGVRAEFNEHFRPQPQYYWASQDRICERCKKARAGGGQ